MSVPLALLASSLPPGSKALAALVDAHGGELTALFAKIDTMLGGDGDGSAKATQRKLRPLVAAGWAMTRKSGTGHQTIQLRRTVSDLWRESVHPTGLLASTGLDENRPVALGGRGVASSNSHDLIDPPTPSSEAVSAAAQQRLEDITTAPGQPSEAVSRPEGDHEPPAALDVLPACHPSGPQGRDGANPRETDSPRAPARTHRERESAALRGETPGRSPGPTGREAPGQLAIVPDPPKPAKHPRIPRNWSCSPDELVAMTSVLAALWEARRAAGMGVGPKPRKVTKAACGPYKGTPGLLGRYRELVGEGELDSVALLGAVVRAKVQAQGKRTDSPKHVEGHYATGITICREDYWSANLAAGRALMKRDNKPAKPKRIAEIDGRPLVGSELAVWDEHANTGWAYAAQRVRGHRIEQAAQ